MRFSLKWLLAGIVYAAIVAAAFAKPHWAYADILWGVTFFSLVYATALAVFSRGRSQSATAGFVFAGVALLLCLHFAPDSLPTGHVIAAASPVQVPQPTPAPKLVTTTYTVMVPTPNGISPQTRTRTVKVFGQPAPSPPYLPGYIVAPDAEELPLRIRSANAVATMLAGLIGCLLGAVAYRRDRAEGE